MFKSNFSCRQLESGCVPLSSKKISWEAQIGSKHDNISECPSLHFLHTVNQLPIIPRQEVHFLTPLRKISFMLEFCHSFSNMAEFFAIFYSHYQLSFTLKNVFYIGNFATQKFTSKLVPELAHGSGIAHSLACVRRARVSVDHVPTSDFLIFTILVSR